MDQDPLEFLGLFEGPSHRRADASVVHRCRPVGRPLDVTELLFGVERDRNRAVGKGGEHGADALVGRVENLKDLECQRFISWSFEEHGEVRAGRLEKVALEFDLCLQFCYTRVKAFALGVVYQRRVVVLEGGGHVAAAIGNIAEHE
jgi:hypothetical protein